MESDVEFCDWCTATISYYTRIVTDTTEIEDMIRMQKQKKIRMRSFSTFKEDDDSEYHKITYRKLYY